MPADVYLALAGALVHGTHWPLAVAVQAARYCPTAHDDVSQDVHVAPCFQYPAWQEIWQLVGSPVWPTVVKMALVGRFMHDEHTPSAVGVHCVRYCPTAHGVVLHAWHVPPFEKYPGLHTQSQASEPYGLPADVYLAFAGALVQDTHWPLAAAVQAVRYLPTSHEVVSHATQLDPTLKYPVAQLVWQLPASPKLPGLT